MKHLIIISLLLISNLAISQDKICWLTSKTLKLPTISQDIGDTLSIASVSHWVSKNPINAVDKEIQKIINRGLKYFLINQTRTFITVGFLEDEGEYLAVYAYTINKSNCKVISIEILAEETAWENGFTSTYTHFEKGHIPKRISYQGAQQNEYYHNWYANKTSEELLLKNDGNWQIGRTKEEPISYQPKNNLIVWAISGLNMRIAPDLNSEKITTIPYGERVRIIEKDKNASILEVVLQSEIDSGGDEIPAIKIKGGWSKVLYRDKVGYVFDGFISKLPALKISVDTLKNNVKRPIVKERFYEWATRNFGKFKTISDEAIIYNKGLTTTRDESPGGVEITDLIPNVSLDEMLLFYNVLLRVEYLNQDDDKDNDIWIIKEANRIHFKCRNSPYDITLEQKGTTVIVNQFDSFF